MDNKLSSSYSYAKTKFVFISIIIVTLLSILSDIFLIFFGEENLFYIILVFIIAIAAILFLILFLVFYSMWLYRFHDNITLIDKSYPITKGGSMARFWIPIYNLYGIWNIHSTYTRKLKNEADIYMQKGEILGVLFPIMFILLLVSRVLGRLLLKNSFKNYFDESTELIISFVSNFFDIFLYVIWLNIIKIMQQSLEYKIMNINSKLSKQ